jgi:hypothetical protein
MMSKVFKILTVIFVLVFACGCKASAQTTYSGGKYILPKSFKIDDKLLPPLENKQQVKPPAKSVSTQKKPPVVTASQKSGANASTQKPVAKSTVVEVKKIAAPPLPQKNTVLSTTVTQKSVQTQIPAKPVVNKSVKTTLPQKAIIKVQAPITLQKPVANKTISNTSQNSIHKAPAATSLPKPAVVKTMPQRPVVQTVQKQPVATVVYNNISLTSLVKNYKYSYDDTLKSTMVSLLEAGLTPVSYNTDKGQIIARLSSGKEVFVLIVPFGNTYTCVRITPTDGNYNLPMNTINQVFSSIDLNLKSN